MCGGDPVEPGESLGPWGLELPILCLLLIWDRGEVVYSLRGICFLNYQVRGEMTNWWEEEIKWGRADP